MNKNKTVANVSPNHVNNHLVADVQRAVSRVSGARFVPDRFTDLGGLPLVSSRLVPDDAWYLGTDPATGSTVVFVGEYDESASECIGAELVACTLGARSRPELMVSNL